MEHTADTAAVDMDSARLSCVLEGGVEEEWGSWQSAPRGQMLSCSYWPVPVDGERPLPLHTVLVSVNCAGLFASCPQFAYKLASYAAVFLHRPSQGLSI